jgi:hypothetical protein
MSVVNLQTSSDADFLRTFDYKTALGVGIDIFGVTMRMMVRKNAEDVTALMELSTSSGDIVIINTPTGRFSLRIPFAKLLELPPGEYEHSLIMTSGGIRTPIWRGTLTHKAGPTR